MASLAVVPLPAHTSSPTSPVPAQAHNTVSTSYSQRMMQSAHDTVSIPAAWVVVRSLLFCLGPLSLPIRPRPLDADQSTLQSACHSMAAAASFTFLDLLFLGVHQQPQCASGLLATHATGKSASTSLQLLLELCSLTCNSGTQSLS